MKLKSVISPRVGLALGGGAARGLSHIGVIQVVEQAGVRVHAVAGTSMGAIVGALYIIEGSVEGLMTRMNGFFKSQAYQDAEFDVLRERDEDEDPGWLNAMTGLIRKGYKYSLSVTRQSIIDRDTFGAIVEELIPDVLIEDLPAPFAAVSLDVTNGREVVWTRGSLRDAIWSSSAIPGFFPPLEKDGMVMVDGAWTNAVPVGPLRDLGADRVIAVDISREIEEMIEYKRGVSLILRAAVLTSKHLREKQIREADLIIRPDVGCIHWADFRDPEELIQKGRDAALVSLENIRVMKRFYPAGPIKWLARRLVPGPDGREEDIREEADQGPGIEGASLTPNAEANRIK